MQLLLITDIFGLNQDIKDIEHWLTNTTELPVKIIDPYRGCWQSFSGDLQAYESFIEQCGHQHYVQRLIQGLSHLNEEVIIIGFSAGASAAWQFIDNHHLENQLIHLPKIKHFIGFYPSQIRHHTHLTPSCPSTLIFPISEPHFDVTQVKIKLSLHANVKCLQTNYHHGFMNVHSINYSARASLFYRQQLSYLHSLINEQCINELLMANT